MRKSLGNEMVPSNISRLGDLSVGDEAVQRLAAIVQFSDDAIVGKDLNGIVTDWNGAAERLYGYTAEEMIGTPITRVIPEERLGEEDEILSRLRRGERIDHYETVRKRKDGSLVDVSLTVSPIRDGRGKVVGASKIARDITERKRAEEQKMLLLREMNHRVKNLFALSSSLVNLSARTATSVKDLVSILQDRFGALARAHSLTMRTTGEPTGELSANLRALLEMALAPFNNERDKEEGRVTISGADIALIGSDVTSFALILHELATNAAKHGALVQPEGKIYIECAKDSERLNLVWREQMSVPAEFKPSQDGFGSFITRATVAGSLGGEFTRTFLPDGLIITISIQLVRLKGSRPSGAPTEPGKLHAGN